MSIAEDMKKLTEDIVTSYDMRVKSIGTLVKDTHQMLKGFNSEHAEMAEKLSSDLAAFIAGLVKDTHQMLKGFDSEHKEMSAKLSADLKKFVGGLVKETAVLVKKFQAEHKKMAEELEADLAKSETDRLKGETDRIKVYKGMMGDIRKGVRSIETYVAKKLKEFTDDHADMSAELKKELARYVGNIVRDTRKLLSGYADERENMAANWQALTAAMGKKRGGKPIRIEAGEKVRTVAAAVKKPRKKARKAKSKKKK